MLKNKLLSFEQALKNANNLWQKRNRQQFS
jgi:hypothetical protein